MPVICVGINRWLPVSHDENKYLSKVLHMSAQSSTFVLGLRLWPTYSHIKLFIMYFQTIEVARGMVHSMIADADRAHGGPANATVRSSEFIPNCMNRIEQLLGSITAFEMPTQAQIDAVEACIALPLCSGLDSSGILRQRAIENSVMQMWSHLNAPVKLSGNMVEVPMDTDHA